MKREFKNFTIKSSFPENEVPTVENFFKYNWELFKNNEYVATIYRTDINFYMAEAFYKGSEEEVIDAIKMYISHMEYRINNINTKLRLR